EREHELLILVRVADEGRRHVKSLRGSEDRSSLVVDEDDGTMGPGWGVTLRKRHGATWKPRRPTRTQSLLIGFFRVVGWRIVFSLAAAVTPEVAGSSPVAPAFAWLFDPEELRA